MMKVQLRSAEPASAPLRWRLLQRIRHVLRWMGAHLRKVHVRLVRVGGSTSDVDKQCEARAELGGGAW
jgi:hypothetical protein